ncbi:sensor histidine kinase [Paenibacillus sepulcri]|uniref:Heme sensor protein HssS n=1 Tax=Paenibacillus sepulcri TaxID=359917 RepID=A0ABS7C3S7_9BACL|nr:HAMP domain-containing histidine kinase [Paenibacillus sepulcri]
MIKYLYIRLIITFLATMIISMIFGFIINGRLYGDQLRNYIQDNVVINVKAIVQSYQQSNPDNVDALMKGMMSLPNYSIRVFDPDGRPLEDRNEGESTDRPMEVSADQINIVLNGGVYRDLEGHGFQDMMVGLPFSINDKPYALFAASEFGSAIDLISGFLKKQLFIVLLFGIVFIVISARYIVQPIQHLTKATRRMAKGDFSIRLTTRRKDEIGQLTASFNQMALELGMLDNIRRQFISDVSHEIQSPLTSIIGFTQALQHKQMDESSRMRLLRIIEEESNRLSRLSENLLQLNALEFEHLQLNRSEYRLDEQIRNVVIAYEPQWSSKRLNFELELDEILIEGDQDKLNQLWSNLIGNSIKFTEERGGIWIKAKRDNNAIEVSLTDDGHGIPEDEIHHIFKPFYKADKSRDRTIPGSGIGLSIVKRIVDLHQGEIDVKSRIGQGTTITVTLPLFHKGRK